MVRRIGFARKLQEREMKDLCAISKPGTVHTQDSHGEDTTAPEEVATDVECFYYTVGGNERLVAAGIAAIGDFILGFKNTMSGILKSDMTVVVAEREPFPERTFHLKWVDDDPGNLYVQAVASERG